MAKQVKEEVNIDQVINNLQELVMSQQKALGTADKLLHLKDCVIAILEEQKKLNNKENNILKICFFGLVACNILSTILSFFS